MGKIVYDIRDFENASADMLRRVNKAVVAAAFQVRDDARKQFLNGGSIYKKHTPNHDYSNLANGIMIGKLTDGRIKVHALGDNSDQHYWKARLFVGGTTYRTQTKVGGTNLSNPYQKGYIKPNDAISKSIDANSNTLNNFINNVINNGK